MLEKTIIVKGCNPEMCPYCKLGSHPFYGRILYCEYYQCRKELDLCGPNGYKIGYYPMWCPL